jgi:hypothetical protein
MTINNSSTKQFKKTKRTPNKLPAPKVIHPKKTRRHNLLFWNVKKKDLSNTVDVIAAQHDADIILLAEVLKKDTDIYKLHLEKKGYMLRTTSSSKIKIFDNISNTNTSTLLSQNKRITCVIYDINGEQILVVGVHLFSKAAMKQEVSRMGFAQEALAVIEEFERKYNIKKTIIIGDFNMNPFEVGMIDFFGLHTTMCSQTAQQGARIISGTKKRYFFNPSWKAYSNVGKKNEPPGTIFYDHRYDTSLPYWNLLDQVIIRPELIIGNLNFKIIHEAEAKGRSLLNSDLKPNESLYSDHLPILYSIKL